MKIYQPKNILRWLPYLKDLINNLKPLREANDEDNTECGEWRIQLVMQNNFISTKKFQDTRIIYLASKWVEVFMGTGTNVAIDKLFNTTKISTSNKYIN